MNFKDLMTKLQHIEENTEINECGGEESHTQADSTTMSVSMNGSGKGGIRDLMNILRNIESGETEPSHNKTDHALFGDGEEMEADESYENSVDGGSEANVYGIDAVTVTGNDMHSKGKEAPKQAGGGNPWNVSEELTTRLRTLYNEVKLR